SGGPYGFPEMRVFKYASKERNLFINQVDKTVEFIINYSKNKSHIPICKVVDELTSDYIIYAIMVISPIIRTHNHKMNYLMKRDLLYEISSDSDLNRNDIGITPQQNLDDKEITSQILDSYLFADPITRNLIGNIKFDFLFKHYPSYELEDLLFNFRALRQAIIDIQRYQLGVDDADMRINPAVARRSGHSLLTDI
ncbi:hypothetical protein Kpol_301p4, partial [Vanderwaltozyma polyspora DSM 70294]